MGIIEPIEKAINQLIRVLWLPCAVDPAIYVETAFDTVLSLLYQLEEPDFREAITKVTGHSAFHSAKEGVEKVLKLLPPSSSKVTRFFFTAAKWGDLSTFYAFLAHLIADGLIDWSSMILELNPCDLAVKHAVGSGPFFFGAIDDKGNWGTLDFDAPAGSKFNPVWPSGGWTVPPGKAWALACSASFSDFGGHAVSTWSRIRTQDTSIYLDFDVNDVKDGAVTRPNHVWAHGKNSSADPIQIYCEWSYQGGDLPEHEAFADHTSHGYIFIQD